MNKLFSIRSNILFIFFTITFLIALLLIGQQYYFSSRLSLAAADASFTHISQRVADRIKLIDSKVATMINMAAEYPGLKDLSSDYNQYHSAMNFFAKAMVENPSIYAVYVGYENGDFYELINLKLVEGMHEHFDAPKNSRWLAVKVIAHRKSAIKYSEYLDADFMLIGKKTENSDYDPRQRPWFKKASAAKGVVKTEPYYFSSLNSAGVTYARNINTNGIVLGADITMGIMSSFLAKQVTLPESELFLFNEKGEKISSSVSPKQLKTDALGQVSKITTLSEQEKKFISGSPQLKVSNELDWPPFDFAESGEPMGYVVDLIKLIGLKTGLEFQFVNGYSWNELITLFQEKTLDIFQPPFKTKERETMGLFSEAILDLRNHFITPENAPVIEDIKALHGKKVATSQGWAIQSYLSDNHPEIELVLVDDVLEALKTVATGEADAFIGNDKVAEYMINKYAIKGLNIGVWCKEFDRGKAKQLFLMVQNDMVVLQSILNKALSSLTTQEIQALQSKWFDKAGDTGREQVSMVPAPLLNINNENRGRVLSYQKEGTEYLAFTTYMDSGLGVTEQFGIVVPAHILTDPYLEMVWFSIYVAIALLLLSVPLIMYSANLIVKPIRILMNENGKVRLRKFDNVVNVQTRIKELAELSSSLVSMAEDIKAYQKGQQELMDGFIKLVAGAIDCKSKYTGGHCSRVPELAQMLAKEADSANEGPFKEFTLQTEDEWRELFIGAWLHDCGKVTTPEYVVDKATKLETIFNRIHEVRTRFEVIWRDLQIEHYERLLKGADESESRALMAEAHKELTEEFAFIGECNIGGEFMNPDKQDRVAAIASRTWLRHFDDRIGLSKEESDRFAVEDKPNLPAQENLLSDNPEHIVKRENFDFDEYKRFGFKVEVPQYLFNYGEIYNLCIAKGTLTAEERFKINEHVIMSIKMLESLPLPENLRRVPEYAGTHHETMSGTGYPRKLSKKDLAVPSRIMAIADIFEALTASDRPYKEAKKLSEAIKILSCMRNDGHIDPDLFELFLTSGVYLKYAVKHLKDEQIDEVDISLHLQTGEKT